jgi:hypothetical protein
MDQPHALCRAALVDGLLQGIEDEARVRRRADPPADDPAGEGIDHEAT